MNKQSMNWRAVSDYGFGWLAERLVYEMQVRSGFQALRFPQRAWSENELSRWLASDVPVHPDEYVRFRREHRRPFFFRSSDREPFSRMMRGILGETGIRALTDEAGRIQQGVFSYFFAQQGQLGFPPAWHRNPFTGQSTSSIAHWSRIPMFSSATGDLKFIWEPGRFASAYNLARAFWATGNDSYAETFWQLVESWQQANPPNHGAHWKCGQETSLRILAWCFALSAFEDAAATTHERVALMVGMIAAQADRVAGDHVYARLQRNNHSISEGVGLWTVGLLFPELQRAGQWRDQGREILIDEASRQIARDGSYIQNSINYHRLMLQDYTWAIRLGELCGEPLPEPVVNRLAAAVEFLYQMQDEGGQAPCYGPNDGALILPLNTCDYSDFRPAIAAGYYLVNRRRVYEPGPWDEDLLWLFGEESVEAPVRPVEYRSFDAREGGYYTMRGRETFGLTRCVTYRYRPAQADLLHLDLWWRGINVACDPGSYRYYDNPPWDSSLAGTDVHNTTTIDGQDQMTRGPRFMWFDWTKAETLVFARSAEGNLERFEGQHSGYLRMKPPVTHRRSVIRAGDSVWVVVDDLLGEGSHSVRGHWLLHPAEHDFDESHKRLQLNLPCGEMQLYWNAWALDEASADASCGDESKAPRGWRSRYYGLREPALSLCLTGRANLPCRLAWVFILGERSHQVLFDRESIEVSFGEEKTLSVSLSGMHPAEHLSVRAAALSQGGRSETV